MAHTKVELADIIREHGPNFLACTPVTAVQRKALAAIEACRTAQLGGHMQRCDSCAHELPVYNSCRNRHCPKCQNVAKANWLEARLGELLPVEYHHVVFTIPAAVAEIGRKNQRVLYNVLFKAASETLLRIARDPKHLGAKIGFLAVLHTWGQNLHFHPHLHVVVPAGGLSPEEDRWVAARPGFFLPVRVLSALFRSLFLKYLGRAYAKGKLQLGDDEHVLTTPGGWLNFIQKSRSTPWVVYSKAPFGGPRQVLSYLGRYTHRVAISNNRILSLELGEVTFAWRDYKGGNTKKTMTLDAAEFLRRFLLHVLPRGLQRLRYYGLFGNRKRTEKLARCLTLLGAKTTDETTTSAIHESAPEQKSALEQIAEHTTQCPACKSGRLHRGVSILPTNAERAAASGYVRMNSS